MQAAAIGYGKRREGGRWKERVADQARRQQYFPFATNSELPSFCFQCLYTTTPQPATTRPAGCGFDFCYQHTYIPRFYLPLTRPLRSSPLVSTPTFVIFLEFRDLQGCNGGGVLFGILVLGPAANRLLILNGSVQSKGGLELIGDIRGGVPKRYTRHYLFGSFSICTYKSAYHETIMDNFAYARYTGTSLHRYWKA